MNAKCLGLLLAAATSTNLAHAEELELVDTVAVEPKGATAPKAKRRHTRMAIELAALAAIGEAHYFRGDGRANEFDWQLPWDMRALESKLSGDGFRFDGNAWKTNAIVHPASGMAYYMLARHNNYSLGESFLISTGVSLTWEVICEWAEYASINDMLATSTAGVPLGESVHQIVHNWRRANYEVRGGVGTTGDDTFKTVSARASLDLVPTTGEGWSKGGQRVGLAIEVPFDNATRAHELGSKTSLGGYYKNGEDYALYAGVSAEFDYRHKMERENSPWDLLATVAAGPTVDVRLRKNNVTIDAGADVYGDFAMVKSYAFSKWRADHPMERIRNVLRTNELSYYYAMGASVAPRLNVSMKGVSIGGKFVGSLFSSIDSADRDQESLTIETHQTDRDATAEAWVGYELKGASVMLDGRVRHRSGTMNEASDEHTERSLTMTLGYRL